MKKINLKILTALVVLAAMLMSACGAPVTPDPTEAAAAIHTAVAQTIEAEVALATPIPTTKPIETILPSLTPDASATATITVTPSPVPPSPTSITQDYCDNSKFITDVTIPDETVMKPGQPFDKTWTFQNVGTCTWTEGYSIIFSNGDLMNGATRFIGQSVAPQQMVDVTVKLTAPIKPGTYNGIWRLANSKGDPFGQISSVVIIVAEGGAAATATPEIAVTADPTASGTPTPTETPKP